MNIKHGKYGTKAYWAWTSMKQRCMNPKARQYPNYGGRGISICSRWIGSFALFVEDMGEPPDSRSTLERIDCEGNYEPTNCKWAPWIEQLNNKRTNLRLTAFGKTMTAAQWARKLGINADTIRKRKTSLGWTDERCLSTSDHRTLPK